jgi:protocatechuate 3,4-dioxygenase alpha subunit
MTERRTRAEQSPARALTPSQTVGPFLHLALEWSDGPDVVAEGTPGAVRICGVVLDGHGDPVTDALVETWQADVAGCFDHPDDPHAAAATPQGFRGFGRCPTDAEGRWSVRTVKPGALPTSDGALQAPHLDLSVFARGLLDRVVTRLYFPDEAEANAADPLLASIPDEAVRATLVAVPEGQGLRFDIRLQGEHETAFFAV